MAKGLNEYKFELDILANTSQAKKQLQDLQQSLSKLITQSNIKDGGLGISKEISNSIQLAAQLKVQLQNATDVNTGKLNLVKFNQELKNSGTTLAQYRDSLISLGPEGVQAFTTLSSAIIKADAPLINLNKKMKELGNTLSNSIRWQLSSSAIHGFMGAIQGAYGYAQDLNKSLSNISIVTGISSDNMADLAEQANKTAQALSVSTLAYTDAALIYYQQGLRGKDVDERVETTLKLSNVTGESAEEVSSYMTAIWNNFRHGSESLELYADKITALGAATASSSREIAGGLQQFAAVADTVGLSYDYAASALATIVAQTRQSESTVGNGLRTIFSRLQGLKLGETLDDGTDLTKYSEALYKVGVNIKDQNGELKDMDTILDELGAKWEQLSKDQQVALATTVAGVRQYTNFIALLDHYDTFKNNVDIAQSADGTLQEQQERYEKSWEASSKRVRAAWQAIYSDLIDDQFFIKLNDSFAEILKLVDKFIDGIGGIKGVLISLVPIITNLFSNNLASGIDNATMAIMQFTSAGRQAVENRRQEAVNALSTMFQDKSTASGFAASTAMSSQAQVQQQYLDVASQLNERQRSIAQLYLDQHDTLVQNVMASKEEADQAERILNAEERRAAYKVKKIKEVGEGPTKALTADEEDAVRASYDYDNEEAAQARIAQMNAERANRAAAVQEKTNGVYSNTADIEEDLRLLQEETKAVDNLSVLYDSFLAKKEQLTNNKGDYDAEKVSKAQESFISLLNTLEKTGEGFGENTELVEKLAKALGITKQAANEAGEELWAVTGETNLDEYVENIENLDNAITETSGKIDEASGRLQEGKIVTEGYVETVRGASEAHQALITNTANAILNQEDFANKLANISSGISDFAQKMADAVRIISQLTSIINGGMRIAEILQDKDLKPWDKFKQILGVLTMTAPAFLSVSKMMQAASLKNAALKEAETLAQKQLNEAEIKEQLIKKGYTAQMAQEVAQHVAGTGAKIAEAGATNVLAGALGILKAVLIEIILPMMVIAALGAGLVWVFNKIKESTPEGKLEAANKKLEEASEAANKANEAYSNLKSTFESYNDLVENINDIEDPLEKQDAIDEQNEKILDLILSIENWKDVLKDGINYDANGLIEIDKTQQELLRKELQKEASTQRRYELEAKIAQIEAQKEVDFKDYKGPTISTNNGIKNPYYKDDAEWQAMNPDQQQYLGGVDTDQTNKIIEAFAKAGLSNMKDYQGGAGEAVQAQANAIHQALLDAGFTEDEIAQITPQIDSILANVEQSTAFLAAISEREGINANIDALQNSAARMTFGESEDFNNLDTESQKKVIEGYNNLESDDDKAKIENAIANQENLKKVLEEVGIATDDLKYKLETLATTEDSLDLDIDQEEFDTLSNFLNTTKIDGLSDQLLVMKDAADDVAEAILRFDDAIQDVSENYDTWKDNLDTGTIQEQAEAMAGLSDAYADLLDLPDSQLSDSFLKDVDNLELLKEACNGSEEAYKQLQEAAREDILAQVGLNTADFDAKFPELENKINAGLNDIEVGAYVDNAQAIQAMNELINAADMTVEQATALLGSMGVDAEVEQVEVPEEQKQELIDAVPEITSKEVEVPDIVQNSMGGGTVKSTTVEVPVINYQANTEEIAEEGKKTATMLRVKSAKKASGGNFKYTNSKHGNGSASPSKTGNKGSKGGGGGSSKTPKTVNHEQYKNEDDRYHNIKSAIDSVSKSLERLAKLKDRAYGKAKLKYMDQEIDKLKEEVKLTDMYIDEAKKYLELDKQKLDSLGLGAQYDTDGRLVNYEQLLQGIVESYNSAVDAYNSAVDTFNGSAQEEGDDQALDGAKKQLEKAKDTYSKNLEILKQYEQTYQTVQEQMDKRIDLLNQIYDAKLAKVVWKVNIKIEVNDADLKQLEWIRKYLERDGSKGADVIANYSKEMESLNSNIEATKKGLQELFENHDIHLDFDNMSADELVSQLRQHMDKEGLGSELTEEEAAQIREWMDTLMDYVDQMQDAFDAAHEQVNKTFQYWNDELDKQIDKFERYRTILESYNDIIDLTGLRALGMEPADVIDLQNGILHNSQNQLASLKEIRDENYAELQRVQKEYDNAVTDDAKLKWKETLELVQRQYNESNEAYLSSWKDTLQQAEVIWEKMLENISNKYNKTMKELSYLTERFSRQQEVDHLYLDDYEKYYNLNRSAKDLQKSINETTNVVMKSKMNDLYDEINEKMASGVKMSQREADIIEKRVALLQAEAALKDAQNAKSAVRMTRDNEGNFSYTYTADQDMVSEAESNYQEQFYNLMQFERQQIEQVQSEWLQKQQQFQEDLQALSLAYRNGEIEDWDAAYNELLEQYGEFKDYYLDQSNMLFEEQTRLRDNDWQDMQEIFGLELAAQNDFVTAFSETIVGRLVPDYETAEEMAYNWNEAMQTSCKEATEAITTWEQNVKETYTAAGVDVDEFKGKVKEDLTEINLASNQTKATIHNMTQLMNADMQGVISAASAMDQQWAAHLSSMRQQIMQTVTEMNNMLRKLADIENYSYKAGSAAQVAAGAFASAKEAADAAVPAFNAAKDAANAAAEAARDAAAALASLGTAGPSKGIQYYDYRGIPVDSSYPGQKYIGTNRGLQPVSGDTGMYTGAWGTEGKLAILHEKEIVLNKTDTANLLSVVDMVRGLASNFNINNGLQGIAKSIIDNTSKLIGLNTQDLNQNVNISASFPNVQSHNEIELALNNLINSASQYVYRQS